MAGFIGDFDAMRYRLKQYSGGAGGIRTLDRALQPYNGLANRRLQPLGHSSVRPICPTQGRAASGRFQSAEFRAIWTALAETMQRNPSTGRRGPDRRSPMGWA